MLLVLVARLPDRNQLWETLSHAHVAPLLLSAGANLLAIQLKVTRWQHVLRVRGIAYGARAAWLSFTASLYLAMLTPGRVGDIIRIQYLRHDLDLRYSEGLASVVVDRLCDLAVLGVLVGLAIPRLASALGDDATHVAWGVVVAACVCPLALLVPGVSERLFRRVYRRIAVHNDPAGLDEFLTALRAQVGRPLLWTLALTLAAFLLTFGQASLVARSLDLEMSYLDVACLMSVTNLLSLIPVSISGIGVRELFFARMFPSLGLPAGLGVAFGLLVFATINIKSVVLGAIAWQIAPPPVRR